MNTNRIKIVLTLAVVAMAGVAGTAQAQGLEGQLGILTPETLAGINPATGAPWAAGDQYRFAFITSAKRTAEETDIEAYNAWVQDLANASTAYDIGADDGVTWKVIGSTADVVVNEVVVTEGVDARDNTSTNPEEDGTGHPIFLLDGSTLIADDYADLWDREIHHIIDLNEKGEEVHETLGVSVLGFAGGHGPKSCLFDHLGRGKIRLPDFQVNDVLPLALQLLGPLQDIHNQEGGDLLGPAGDGLTDIILLHHNHHLSQELPQPIFLQGLKFFSIMEFERGGNFRSHASRSPVL